MPSNVSAHSAPPPSPPKWYMAIWISGFLLSRFYLFFLHFACVSCGRVWSTFKDYSYWTEKWWPQATAAMIHREHLSHKPASVRGEIQLLGRVDATAMRMEIFANWLVWFSFNITHNPSSVQLNIFFNRFLSGIGGFTSGTTSISVNSLMTILCLVYICSLHFLRFQYWLFALLANSSEWPRIAQFNEWNRIS